ncbi:hypothetical protein [Dactylosporangium salmoneum]
MLSTHRTTSPPASATAVVPEEDWLRTYNGSWRDTAYGRAEHYRRCPESSHRRCTTTPAAELGRAA